MGLRSQRQSKIGRSGSGDGFAKSLIGNGQLGNPINTLEIAADSSSGSPSLKKKHSVAFEPRRSSSKKAIVTPKKTVIHEEMSGENKVMQSSPSVIARLMGLDALPPPQPVAKKQKEIVNSSPRRSYEGHSFGMSTSEHEKFKDVFEINDSKKVEKHRQQSVFRGTSRPKQNETDVAFVRQKFMEAKRLSTDETLRSSREFNDALEVLDSNKDLFLKFLQEPNSLFTNHLNALKASRNAILKSAKGKKHEDDEVSSMTGKIDERRTQKQISGIASIQKAATSLFHRSPKEHTGSLSHKLLKSRYAGKTDTSHRARIVVLKPSLENCQKPSYCDNYQFDYRRHSEFQQSTVQESDKGMQQPHLSDSVDLMLQRTKGSREIARATTKVKYSAVSIYDKPSISDFNRSTMDEGLCALPSMLNLGRSDAYQQTSENFDCCNDMSSPSSSYSTESMLSMEDKKGQSDNRARGMRQIQLCPPGISSRNRCKDGCSTILSRSSSLPPSSTVYEAPRFSRRRRVSDIDSCSMLKDVLNLGNCDPLSGNLYQKESSPSRSFKLRNYKPHLSSGGEENKLPVREIHVNHEELRNGIYVSDHSEVRPMVPKLFDSTTGNSSHPVNNASFTGSMNAEMLSVISEGHIEQSLQNEESSSNNHINEAIQEVEPGDPQVHSESLTVDQLTPVSVLELPAVESGPECFEKVNADLQGLRKELELLRLESNACDNDSEHNTEDCNSPFPKVEILEDSEENTADCDVPLRRGEIPQTHRNQEERDFSYLVDILVDSGVHNDAYCCLKHPVDSIEFEKLEEKYGKLRDWSKPERRLLFDLVSSVLAEVLPHYPWVKHKRSVGPTWGREGLAESVWQKVDALRKEGPGKTEEKTIEPRWFDLGADVDGIGKEIEEMLKDELLEELVSEFYCELV